MIAVTFALPAESSGFVRLIRNRRTGGRQLFGEFKGQQIVVCYTGVGEKSCRRRIAELFENLQVESLISAGFAGALHDGCAIGDLLLAENFSTDTMLAAAKSRLAEARAQVGQLTTAAAVTDSAEQRRHSRDQTGADAVDMETRFIAEACAQRNIPLLSLRAISDSPSFPFPAPPAVLFDIDRQRTDPAKLLGYIARHPRSAWRLIAFAARIANVRRALTAGLESVLSESA